MKNYIGKQFGELVVIAKDYNVKSSPGGRKYTKWICRCFCGKEVSIFHSNLTGGTTKSCGCQMRENRSEDLIGKRFGKLVVLDKDIPQKSKHGNLAKWICKCDCCNKIVSIYQGSLLSGKTKSCGYWAGGKGRKLPYGEANLRRRYTMYKTTHPAAKSKGFELTLEEFKALTCQNCYYCGSPPENRLSPHGENGTVLVNGVDRVDSLIGYIFSNCVPCCKYCNSAKNNFSQDEFLKRSGLVYKKWKKKIDVLLEETF